MPLYEYLCSNCEHLYEVRQAINDSLLVVCPSCNQPSLVKQISLTSFRLSGIGYYETDFKTKNRRNIKVPDHSNVVGGQEE